MTYAEGDPGHIDVHESIRLLFMAAGLDPDLIPAEATLGATTHIEDHNKIAEALQWIDDNGVIGINPATESGTTGSPTTTTPSTGKTAYRYTGSGSVTVATAGTVKVRICGGGGGGGNDGPGGGGGYIEQDVYLPVGTHIVTIGAGGPQLSGNVTPTALAYNGGNSSVGPYGAIGGGHGGFTSGSGGSGGSGGGGSRDGSGGSPGMGSQGYAGGSNGGGYGGAGGGAGGAGASGSATDLTGGIGIQSSIDGTARYRCAGGNGSKGSPSTAAGQTAYNTAGAANSGAGGGANSKAGGSGEVTIVFG